MSLDRTERLKALGLWPLWRLRDAPMPESPDQVPAAEAPPAPTLSMPAEPPGVGRESGPEADATPPVSSQNTPSPIPASTDITRLDWDALRAAVTTCTRCGLHAGRKQGVPGVGDVHADWLFVGEAPGAEEDRLGEPFVGQAGKLLDAMLAAIGLRRGENVYIANVLKSRPPGNRDPKPEEVAACLPYLERQIDLIQPKVIIALGRFAAQSLLLTETSISRLRGHVHRYRGVPMVVTYHPAYLLRNLVDKAKVWEDLCLAQDVMTTARANDHNPEDSNDPNPRGEP